MVLYFKDMPKVKQWLYTTIRQGSVSGKAVRVVEKYIATGKI
jgi:hypothetical protein